MLRHGRFGSFLLTGALVVASVLVLTARDACAQTPQPGEQATRRQFVADEWQLRGVVLAEPGAFAVLQHRASSQRQQLLRVGDAVERGVVVASIAADRIVLNADGRPITLRLAHGGERVFGRRPVPRRAPSALINRRDR